MKILFTGASSFTGYWFVKELARSGHDVTAVFRRPFDDYREDVRSKRVAEVAHLARAVFGMAFGDENFLKLIGEHEWDVMCHHAAEVTNYKSMDFDVAAALKKNTHHLPLVLQALSAAGCKKIILTGSVFETDEGAGSSREAFSPYGLSKAMTWQMFRFFAQTHEMTLGKFVISNPFGPYEEPRFTHFLIKSWFDGAIPAVNTPAYVRDNIHVSLLAKTYETFVCNLSEGISRINPSGYVESQGAFTQRLAKEMRPRLGKQCLFESKRQIKFTEPYIRVNTDPPDVCRSEWDETKAWDEFADYYLGEFSSIKMPALG